MRRKDESTKRRILRYIDTYYSQNAAPPSVRDVADGAGVALSTAHRYLVAMRESGELDYAGRRGIGTPRMQKEARMMSAPVLVSVRCGPGEWEEEAVLEYIRLPASFYGEGEFFVLVAKGESMTGAGICPGDYVVVRRQRTAKDGDLVVALYDDGLSSLKKLVRASGRAVLRSCSDDAEAYPDIPVRELQIQGVAVGEMHRF